jgi:catechol 2,3-dioxygenase-like lactoylglutathione lyase family enzyme
VRDSLPATSLPQTIPHWLRARKGWAEASGGFRVRAPAPSRSFVRPTLFEFGEWRLRPQFIGAVGVIARSLAEGKALFVDSIGLPLKQSEGTNFLHTERLEGSKYFGVWSLSEAAKSCFGQESWPHDHPIPQMFIEIEVDSPAGVAHAASELESKGYHLLHPPRTDPWGQTVTRLQTADGLLVGISYVPWMHRKARRKTHPARSPRRRRTLPRSRKTVRSGRRP